MDSAALTPSSSTDSYKTEQWKKHKRISERPLDSDDASMSDESEDFFNNNKTKRFKSLRNSTLEDSCLESPVNVGAMLRPKRIFQNESRFQEMDNNHEILSPITEISMNLHETSLHSRKVESHIEADTTPIKRLSVDGTSKSKFLDNYNGENKINSTKTQNDDKVGDEESLTGREPRKTNISPSLQLLIALRFYASGSFQIIVADFGGIHQTTASKIIRKVSAAINSLYDLYIKHPSTEEEILNTQSQFYKIAKFPRCVGALDCTHVRIMSPGGEYAELFRNRKGYFSLNVQAVCDADLLFIDVVTRWPGSTHDSTIFNNSRLKYIFESGSREDQLMLGDGGYAGYSSSKYLMIPLDNPKTNAEKLYNESQIRTRNTIERCFGVWKRRFPILSMGLRVNLSTAQDIITSTAILHNICRNNSDEIPPFESNEQQNSYEISMTRMTREYVFNQNHINTTRNSLINYFSLL